MKKMTDQERVYSSIYGDRIKIGLILVSVLLVLVKNL